MASGLQPGEVVVAEKIDRISRLPLAEAELLVATIRSKGARLAVPGIVDLTDLVADSAGVARIVLEAVQEMLLRSRSRPRATTTRRGESAIARGIEIAKRRAGTTAASRTPPCTGASSGCETGMSIARTAELAGCSIAQVKRVTALHRAKASSVTNGNAALAAPQVATSVASTVE